MMEVAEKMGDPTARQDLNKEIGANPMHVVITHKDALDWPQIHMTLCTVYARAVLTGNAVVPKSVSTSTKL
jgi:hypothetical protein